MISKPTLHHKATGIHPGAFVQDTTPATSDLQDHVLWVDTSTAPPYQFKVWDRASGTWLLVGRTTGVDTDIVVQNITPSIGDTREGVLWVDTSSGPPYQLKTWDATSHTWLHVGCVCDSWPTVAGQTPHTQPPVGSSAGEGDVYSVGVSGTPPTDWQTVAFDDSGWLGASLQTIPVAAFSSPLPGTDWITDHALGQPEGYVWLYRKHFSLATGAVTSANLYIHVDNYTLGVWLNGILIANLASDGDNYTVHTISVPSSLLVPGADNVLAIGIVNLSDGSATALNYQLVFDQSLSAPLDSTLRQTWGQPSPVSVSISAPATDNCPIMRCGAAYYLAQKLKEQYDLIRHLLLGMLAAPALFRLGPSELLAASLTKFIQWLIVRQTATWIIEVIQATDKVVRLGALFTALDLEALDSVAETQLQRLVYGCLTCANNTFDLSPSMLVCWQAAINGDTTHFTEWQRHLLVYCIQFTPFTEYHTLAATGAQQTSTDCAGW